MNKIIFLCSLLIISNIFSMDQKLILVRGHDGKDVSAIKNLPMQKACIFYSKPNQKTRLFPADNPKGVKSLISSFSLRYNQQTNISLIHYKKTVVARIAFDDEAHEGINKILDPTWVNPTSYSLSATHRTFWILIPNEKKWYKITSIQEVDYLDEATKEEKILIDAQHEPEHNSDKKWLAGIAIGIPVAMAALGLGALYALLGILHYNK